MSNSSCKDCKHWEKHGKNNEKGTCHCHAPRPEIARDGPIDRKHYVSWPITDATDYCSEIKTYSIEVAK